MSLISKLKASLKFTGYCFSPDFRRSLQTLVRQQGEVTSYYSLDYQIEKYPALDSDNPEIPLLKKININTDKTAIILQGPIWRGDSFTLNTCRLYRFLYPHVQIYLSIWDDEFIDNQNCWDALGVVFILSPKPRIYDGLGSLQFQVALVKNALIRAKLDGVKFVFKGRCDQRMLNPYFIKGFHYYSSLISPDENRLTFGLHDSIYYNPYKINDQFMYGEIDELLIYWDDRASTLVAIHNKIRQALGASSPEQLLYARYLQNSKSIKLNFSLAQYHESCGRFIAFTDEGTESMLWIKYPYRYKPHWSFNNRIWRQWNWLEWHEITIK